MKVDPTRLPKPPLPPTLPHRERVPCRYNEHSEEEMEERTIGLKLTRTNRKKQGFGKIWTYEEETELLEQQAKGVPIEKIAESMGRTTWSVKARLGKIKNSGRIVE